MTSLGADITTWHGIVIGIHFNVAVKQGMAGYIFIFTIFVSSHHILSIRLSHRCSLSLSLSLSFRLSLFIVHRPQSCHHCSLDSSELVTHSPLQDRQVELESGIIASRQPDSRQGKASKTASKRGASSTLPWSMLWMLAVCSSASSVLHPVLVSVPYPSRGWRYCIHSLKLYVAPFQDCTTRPTHSVTYLRYIQMQTAWFPREARMA
jgi:hypothetical protein